MYLGLGWVLASVIVGGMFTYLVAPVGTEIVIPLTILALKDQGGGGPFLITLAVGGIVLVDVCTALFMLWNFDLAERIPILGKFIQKTEAKCRAGIRERGWRERATLTALVAYVALPVQMSGGVVGSILGRVMGIRPRRVFFAVVGGSSLGAIPVGLLSLLIPDNSLRAFKERFEAFGWLQTITGVLIILGFLGVIYYLYTRGRNARGARGEPE